MACNTFMELPNPPTCLGIGLAASAERARANLTCTRRVWRPKRSQACLWSLTPHPQRTVLHPVRTQLQACRKAQRTHVCFLGQILVGNKANINIWFRAHMIMKKQRSGLGCTSYVTSKTLPGRLELPTLRLTASRSSQLS